MKTAKEKYEACKLLAVASVCNPQYDHDIVNKNQAKLIIEEWQKDWDKATKKLENF